MRERHGKSELHAWGNDPNSSSSRCARAFARWWTYTAPPYNFGAEAQAFAQAAFGAGWIAAEAEARHKGVDGVHPQHAPKVSGER